VQPDLPENLAEVLAGELQAEIRDPPSFRNTHMLGQRQRVCQRVELYAKLRLSPIFLAVFLLLGQMRPTGALRNVDPFSRV
jgi:hypothetical protein